MTAQPPSPSPDAVMNPVPAAPTPAWPQIDLRQLQRLTDDTGLFQHARYATPDPNHGYCIDDNARGLIAGLRHAALEGHDETVVSLHRYLMFVVYAFNQRGGEDPGGGRFRNFMGYDRRWLEDVGSEDSQGRAFWSLGETVAHAPTPNLRDLAADVYRRALPGMLELRHFRSWAFALFGVQRYLLHEPQHGISRQVLGKLASWLFEAWERHAGDDWPWWEDIVTYDNAKPPHALLLAGQTLGHADYLRAGFTTLRWLIAQQMSENLDGQPHLSVIGNDGWLPRDGTRAAFDQQPLEAYALVDACLDAARFAELDTTFDPAAENGNARDFWERQAWMCFTWFLGRNDLNEPLHDPVTGGCRDGLHADGTNRNQGAESTLAYLLSVLELRTYDAEVEGRMSDGLVSPD